MTAPKRTRPAVGIASTDDTAYSRGRTPGPGTMRRSEKTSTLPACICMAWQQRRASLPSSAGGSSPPEWPSGLGRNAARGCADSSRAPSGSCICAVDRPFPCGSTASGEMAVLLGPVPASGLPGPPHDSGCAQLRRTYARRWNRRCRSCTLTVNSGIGPWTRMPGTTSWMGIVRTGGWGTLMSASQPANCSDECT